MIIMDLILDERRTAMTSREKVLEIFNRKSTNGGAMWTGHPNDATVPIYAEKWGIEPTREAIFEF